MKLLKTSIIILFITISSCIIPNANKATASDEHRLVERPKAEPILFEIQFYGSENSNSKSYKAGKPFPIRCVLKNMGDKPYNILVMRYKSSGIFSSELPVYLSARVVDSTGAILTKNDISGDWWSIQNMWSGGIKADFISLKPGEEIIGIVHLDKILLRAECIPYGLTEGTYTVGLSLGGGFISNELIIKIGKE